MLSPNAGQDAPDWLPLAREMLLPLATAAIGVGGGWLGARKKNAADAKKSEAEAEGVYQQIFERQARLLADLWEEQNKELRAEISELRADRSRLEAEIIALRVALDERSQAVRGVAFVPPAGDNFSQGSQQ